MNGNEQKILDKLLDAKFEIVNQKLINIEDRVTANHSKLINLYEDTIKPQVDKNTKYIEKDKKFKYGMIGVLTFLVTGGGLLLGFWNKIFR